MSTLLIEGGKRLSGAVAVEGNKNSALPLLAACLLTDRECVLTNVPRIRDVDVLIELMAGIGATVEGAGTSTLRVRCERAEGRRGWRSRAATFRRGARSTPICRRWPPWGRCRSTSRATRSKHRM